MNNYKDLIERLIALHEFLYGADAIPSCISESADAIEALVKERQDDVLAYNTLFGELQAALEELAALRKQIDELQPVAWFYCEHGEEYFGHPDGYRPDYAVALYSLGGIKK